MRLIISGVLVASALYAQDLPKGKGGDLIDQRCTSCHTLNRITTQERTRDEWDDSVKAMIDYGTELNAAETKIVLDYLAKYQFN